jgi:glucose/arabinose dehydrogenase
MVFRLMPVLVCAALVACSETARLPPGADDLYVANADAVMRFHYQPGKTRITQPGTRLTDLPAGRNHHWTKNLIASPDGNKLYATVGSNSNVAESGMEIRGTASRTAATRSCSCRSRAASLRVHPWTS